MAIRRRLTEMLAGAAVASLAGLAVCASGSEPAVAAPAGNGIGTLSATQVLAKSAHALALVSDLTVDGSLKLGPESIAFLVRSAGRGKAVSGTLTVRSGKKVVGPVMFVDLGSVLYLRADAAFWTQEISAAKTPPTGAAATAAVARLAGRWIEITGAEAKSFSTSFGELTQPGRFAQSLLTGDGKLAKGAPRMLRGREVLPITTSQGATIFIALTGAPVPVEIAGKSALGTSAVAVTAVIDCPAHLTIAAPAGAVTLATINQSLTG